MRACGHKFWLMENSILPNCWLIGSSYFVRQSLGMGNAACVFMEEIVRYLGIDERARLLARRLWTYIDAPSTEIIASFYHNTRQSGAGLMLDDPTIERLKVRQKEHWRALFNSEFDEHYQRSVTMIGIKHQEIGLDPKWYIAGYAIMKAGFAERVLDAPLPSRLKTALIVTLEKYVAIDMALALSTYSSWLVD